MYCMASGFNQVFIQYRRQHTVLPTELIIAYGSVTTSFTMFL